MDESLKPVRCGCGGKAYIDHETAIYMPTGCRIECTKCHVVTPYYDTEAKAIKVWNRAMGRKKGKWIDKDVEDIEDYPIESWQSAKCSVCGKFHTTPYMYNYDEYRYCPNCGAEMRGEHE